MKTLRKLKSLSRNMRKQARIWLVSSVSRYHSRCGILAVDICSTIGMGAKLEWCLEIMAYCDEQALQPQFRFSYPDSDPSQDFFGRFFSIRATAPIVGTARFVRIHHPSELRLGKDYDSTLNIALAADLIRRYLIIRPEVVDEVNTFVRTNWADSKVLGVHYRGTDKTLEAPSVPYAVVRNAVDDYLSQVPEIGKVFLSSDDMNFIEFMRTHPPARPLSWRDDTFRSRDGRCVHHSVLHDRHEMNRDAIVNCLILSRCVGLIKTASMLSAWSKLFNPHLHVVMLNRPYANKLWFPDRALLDIDACFVRHRAAAGPLSYPFKNDDLR